MNGLKLLLRAAALTVLCLTALSCSRLQAAPESHSAGAHSGKHQASATLASNKALSLGTLTEQPATSGCPPGSTCREVAVTCPKVSVTGTALLQIQNPVGQKRGLVMLFSGGMGTALWGQAGQGGAFTRDLSEAGFEVVTVGWRISWLAAPEGSTVGPARLACRPATVVKWVHDHLYTPLHVHPSGVGQCGFCLSGNSGGASQVAYALSRYGLRGIVNGLFPTSGPPHAALAKGCLPSTAPAKYWYNTGDAAIIDLSYGYRRGGGPCSRHDAAFVGHWNRDSVDSSSGQFYYPKTRVEVIFGAQDPSVAVGHGRAYVSRLKKAHSPYVSVKVVGGMSHEITSAHTGLNVLWTAIMSGLRGVPSAPSGLTGPGNPGSPGSPGRGTAPPAGRAGGTSQGIVFGVLTAYSKERATIRRPDGTSVTVSLNAHTRFLARQHGAETPPKVKDQVAAELMKVGNRQVARGFAYGPKPFAVPGIVKRSGKAVRATAKTVVMTSSSGARTTVHVLPITTITVNGKHVLSATQIRSGMKLNITGGQMTDGTIEARFIIAQKG